MKTLDNEIKKRLAKLDEMNSTSNWTKSMEKMEEILNDEIRELIEARDLLAEKYYDEFSYIKSQY